MYQIACPACGAPVGFRSTASVMAVCGYCQSTLLREADAVRDIGKMSSIVEDYSPIQIGTGGVYEGRRFSVVGRIQLVYEAGYWNEWFVWFDDGTSGWLSETPNGAVLTMQADMPENAPAFERILPGHMLGYAGVEWMASDVRRARCTGGAGELPFRVGEGWEARVVDYRKGARFLTLDYSEGVAQAWQGKVATLQSLKCNHLRSTHDIASSAGRMAGSAATLACPHCGAAIAYRAGVTQHMVCASCATAVALRGQQTEVLARHEELLAWKTTLALGDTAQFHGAGWQIIGMMVCRETGGEASEWTEYLLFNPQRGFHWLVESPEGWDSVQVLDVWPDIISGAQLRYEGRAFTKLYEYGAEVIHAAGAFNWQVKIGDRVWITDYASGNQRLSMERSASEISISLSNRISAQTVATWFGKPALAATAPGRDAVGGDDSANDSLWKVAAIFTAIIIALNLPLFFRSEGDPFEFTLFSLVALWWPVFKGEEDEDD